MYYTSAYEYACDVSTNKNTTGQDPKKLMTEGGLTLLGFLIVLGPTLLRGFGVGVPTAEDQVTTKPLFFF